MLVLKWVDMSEAQNLAPTSNESTDPRYEKLSARLLSDIVKGVDVARTVLGSQELTEEAVAELRRKTKFLAPPFVEFKPDKEDAYQAAQRCRGALALALNSSQLRKEGLEAGQNERIDEMYPEYPHWSLMKDLVTITPLIDTRTYLQGEVYTMAVVQHRKCFIDGTPLNWRALLWFSLDHAVHAFDVRSKIKA